MPQLHFGPPYVPVRDGVTQRIVTLDPSNGRIQIDNWQYFAGSVNVRAGFSKVLTLNPTPRDISIEVDFMIDSDWKVEALPGYAAAEISLSFSAISTPPRLGVGGLSATPAMVRRGFVTPFGAFGDNSSNEFYTLRIPFKRFNPSGIESVLVTAMVDSWAIGGGWAGAVAMVQRGSGLDGFFVCF